MESDSVIEPARAHLMPLLHEIRAAAKAAGALGLVISGAGPTLCAVCRGAVDAQKVATVDARDLCRRRDRLHLTLDAGRVQRRAGRRPHIVKLLTSEA